MHVVVVVRNAFFHRVRYRLLRCGHNAVHVFAQIDFREIQMLKLFRCKTPAIRIFRAAKSALKRLKLRPPLFLDNPSQLRIEAAIHVCPLDASDEPPVLLAVIAYVMALLFSHLLHCHCFLRSAAVLNKPEATRIRIAAVEIKGAYSRRSALARFAIENINLAQALPCRRINRPVILI